MKKIETIRSLCNKLEAVAPSLSDGSGKAYEIREFLREALRVKNDGSSFRYSDGTVSKDSLGKYVVRLRGSPGFLENLSGKKYTHYHFYDKGEEIEIHAGVNVLGKSQAGHELDVMVVKSRYRQECSLLDCRRYCRPVKLAIECKSSIKSVDKHLVRSFALTSLDHRINKKILRSRSGVSRNSLGLLEHFRIKNDVQP